MIVVLAAQRDGRLDPLAAEAGVTHKCLVPIGGLPLLAHVLSALAEVGDIDSIRISVEDGAADRLRPIAALSGLPVDFVTAADNIADSVYRAAEGAGGCRHGTVSFHQSSVPAPQPRLGRFVMVPEQRRGALEAL